MVQIGKRYRCEECGTVVICLRGSEEATWTCCDREVVQQAVKKLPSSD
jgi:hypothetical protein